MGHWDYCFLGFSRTGVVHPCVSARMSCLAIFAAEYFCGALGEPASCRCTGAVCYLCLLLCILWRCFGITRTELTILVIGLKALLLFGDVLYFECVCFRSFVTFYHTSILSVMIALKQSLVFSVNNWKQTFYMSIH